MTAPGKSRKKQIAQELQKPPPSLQNTVIFIVDCLQTVDYLLPKNGFNIDGMVSFEPATSCSYIVNIPNVHRGEIENLRYN
jgi:hypothetical protein